ncbi:MAG TPA: DUF6569 family protein [Hyphomicrobiales bacterium]|nr:DUF6569 family protein [Hyphomicrobiales bacterium]
MRILFLTALVTTVAAFTTPFLGRARAETNTDARISGPFTYENLTIYFIHGESAPGPAPLTLQEALAKGTVRVVETGTVNELKVENLGEEDVYIQSGDIVKGGRQDRVLTVSFVLPRKSGEVPISSYCVEHGRWSARGSEDATKFASAYNLMPSREAKLAMKAPSRPAALAGARPADRASYSSTGTSERQQVVWSEVAKTQEKLSANINAPVASPESASSLELSLENDKLKKLRSQYIEALEGKAGADDIVGFAFAVNGRINSADVYPSNALFRKMWNKLLTASVTEAVSERLNAANFAEPSVEAVRAFLQNAENGKANVEKVGALAEQDIRDADAALFVQAARSNGSWVHRNYLAK